MIVSETPFFVVPSPPARFVAYRVRQIPAS